MKNGDKMQVYAINTKTNVRTDFQTIEHAKSVCIPQSAKTGYTFKIHNTNTGELIGNIRPNPHPHRTKSNPNGKLTARLIRQD